MHDFRSKNSRERATLQKLCKINTDVLRISGCGDIGWMDIVALFKEIFKVVEPNREKSPHT